MTAAASRYAKTIALTAAALLAICVPSALALPTGRGYEKVSPADKDGQDILNGNGRAAADGNAATYVSFGAFADSEGGGLLSGFQSGRTPGGWGTQGITPPQAVFFSLASSLLVDYSEDARSSVAVYASGDPGQDGATPGAGNLYRRDPDGTEHTLTFGMPAPPPTDFPPNPTYGGGTPDLSLSAYNFNSGALPVLPTTSGPDAVAGVTNAYFSTGNHDVRLVSVLPNGDSSPTGGNIGPQFGTGFNAVSEDGSEIFWTSGDAEVYVRIDGTDTVQASASQRNNPDPNGVQPKNYLYATPDGDTVFFSSGQKLTNNSQAEPGNPDMYRYDVPSGNLTDLTTADPDGAGVQGVIGVSDNGSRIYFAATGVLAAGATDGQVNLYVRDGGTTTFITTLDQFSDGSNWAGDGQSKTGRVNPSGSTLMFSSRASQLGFDNAGHTEFYVYSLDSDAFACISCRPGTVPTTDAAINQPPGAGISFTGAATFERRNLSNDGSTAFFSSGERLVSADTNGKYDTYMWQDGGSVLVSSGHDPNDSAFMDASRSGDDAFFLTREQLVGTDTDDSVDLYDARVGGGLASQNPPPPPVPCEGDACKPPATPQGGPPPNGTTAVDNPVVPPPPDCSSAEAKAQKKAAKVDKLQKKVDKASGKQKKKLKKKLKQAKKAAKKAEQQADQCNQG